MIHKIKSDKPDKHVVTKWWLTRNDDGDIELWAEQGVTPCHVLSITKNGYIQRHPGVNALIGLAPNQNNELATDEEWEEVKYQKEHPQGHGRGV